MADAKVEERKEKTPEEVRATIDSERARLAQILTRGKTTARVQEILDQLPSDRVGVLVRETDADVSHYQHLGARVETGLKGVHGSGDGRVRIGDTILMSFSVETWQALAELNDELTRAKLDLGKKDYLNAALTNEGVVPFDESRRY